MAASQAELVLAVVGYFLIVGTLLGLSGITGGSIQIPAGGSICVSDTCPADQSFGVATLECIWSLFGDCSQKTVTKSFSTAANIFGFALGYLGFFFQLLTFQLPIHPFLNAIIVLPGATVLIYIGIRFVRGGG